MTEPAHFNSWQFNFSLAQIHLDHAVEKAKVGKYQEADAAIKHAIERLHWMQSELRNEANAG